MSDFFQKPMRSSAVIASAMSGEAEKYAPLPLGSVKVGEPVSFELYLKMKDRKSAEPKIVRCCTPGDIFQKEWYEKLKRLQIQWVYFSLTDVDQIFEYMQKNLEDLLKFGNLSQEEKALQVYDLTQVWILRFFTAEKSRTGEQIP